MEVQNLIKKLSDEAISQIQDSTQHLEGTLLICKVECGQIIYGTYRSMLSVEINGVKHQFLFVHYDEDAHDAINSKCIGEDCQKIFDNHVVSIIEDKIEIIQEELYFQNND